MRTLLILNALLVSQISVSQIIYPYLQSVQPNSIWVTWKTDFNAIPSIAYGTQPTNLSVTATGTTSQFIDAGYSGNYFYNSVQLVNLQPNTKYYYQVIHGAFSSDTLSFKTLPLPGQPATSDGHIRFLIMGDNQIMTTGRYDTLVHKARKKVLEKWGGDPSDHVALTFMVGDQVDLGNLDQYENIHFAYNRALSGEIPIQTTVGNHETYGSLGMNAYYDHFYLDQLSYQGIHSNTENYYAMQAGNVLFVSFSSEHTGTPQFNWLQNVLNAADSDTTVDWIITLSHRPYEAEQYVGDISPWVKNTAVPLCMSYSKYFMHIGAHHHIYSRGQFKEAPVYNIISGGTAWDQYWGQSTEQDFDYIQKTISNWCYQIIDVDVVNSTVDIECYSIGSPIMFASSQWKDNELVDEFHRYLYQPGPDQPTIVTNIPDSIQLPFLIESSPYSSSTAELLNSTEFQFSQNTSFSVLDLDILRDFENLFGQAPGQAADSTEDKNAGIDITEYTIPQGRLGNGKYYVRVRHRDRNLEWSPWSPVDSFIVYNSIVLTPTVRMDTNQYELGDPLTATYTNGPNTPNDWIGIYHFGDTPGTIGSTVWQYTNGPSGQINFNSLPSTDMYFAAYFELNGYNEIAVRDSFYYGNIPVLSTDTNAYPVGATVTLTFSNGPDQNDYIEVLKVGLTHGVHPPAYVHSVNNSAGTALITGLPKGYYTAKYYYENQYQIGEPVYFSVGDTITSLIIDKPVYELGDSIQASWTDAPGIVKDWLGIYHANDDPNVDPLTIYSYFDGVPFGSITLRDTLFPQDTGSYFIVMFTDDSYTEVSNREYFYVEDTSLIVGLDSRSSSNTSIKVYPNPSKGGTITVFSSDYPIEYIQVLDINGKIVYRTENIKNQMYSLLNNELPSGLYILQIQTNKLNQYKLVVE